MGSITIMVTAAELLYTKTGIVTEIKSVHDNYVEYQATQYMYNFCVLF